MSEWHSIPAQFHSFKTVGNILDNAGAVSVWWLWGLFLVFVFCCSLVSVVLCGLLFIIQDLPQRVGFSVTLML